MSSGQTRLQLSLRGVGYGSSLSALGEVTPHARANRVRYEWAGLSEIYDNGPLGIEQAFTIVKAQSHHAIGALTLSIALSGNANPALAKDGRSITLTRGRKTVLRYSGLSATDARGHVLRSWLQLDGSRVLLRVDASGARYPLKIDPFVQQGDSLAPAGGYYGLAGYSVALSGDGNTVLIGAPYEGGKKGAAWVFTRSGSGWTQQGELLRGAGEVGESAFGFSVALSADGNTALIGGIGDNGPNVQSGNGAAWVFIRSGVTWTQQGAKLTGIGEASGGGFGWSVALSADGNTALIGAPNQGGATRVFTRSGETWSQQGEALPGACGTGAALSSDGNTALTACLYEGGYVLVFTRSGNIWSRQGEPLRGGGEVGEGDFGWSVALSSNGNTALIGGINDNGSVANYGRGAAWVFTRSGETWTQQGGKLTGEGEVGEGDFGYAVALSSDGNTALVGGLYDNLYKGAAWVFTRSGRTWAQQGEKLTGGGEGESWFGNGVALAADGKTALIGGPLNYSSGPEVGAAWVFSSSEPVPPQPAVVTETASGVSPTSATLHGAVASESPVTDCHFEYGESFNVYGSSVPCAQTVGAGTSPVSVSASITGLTPGTTYHVRLVATSSGGTGYGADSTFTTTGTSTPTVQTGYAYGDWFGSSATLTGTINPHGQPVEYSFVYGGFPVPVASDGDPLFGHTPTTVITGTSSVNVSAAVSGLARDTLYHVRLLVTYGGGVVWGPEVSFEITPPDPEVYEAPYLEQRPPSTLGSVFGGPALGLGVILKCVPGAWRHASALQSEWVYIENNGQSIVPTGITQSEYFYGLLSVGKLIACQVTPHKLDGHPGIPVLSDVYIIEAPDVAQVLLPAYLKRLWGAADVLQAIHDGYGAVLDCVETADIPGIGAGICLAIITQQILGNPFEDMLKEAVDPPDAHYREVALPKPVAGARAFGYVCLRAVSRAACAKLSAAARAYATATNRVGSLLEVLAVARNRSLIARARHDPGTEAVHRAAVKVYLGQMASALGTQHQAGVAYAELLKRAHVDVRASATTLRRIARRPFTQIVGRSLLARMLNRGYRKSEIQRSLAESARHVKAFDLVRFLREPTLPIPFASYYKTIDINDVRELVLGLARQSALRVSAVPTLLADLDNTRAACTPTARAVATQRFLYDAKPNTQRQVYSFLSAAAQPLIDGNSTIDPYPRCLP